VFEAGALDVVVGAAVLHEQIGLDLVAVAEGIGNTDGAEAIEGEGLIRGIKQVTELCGPVRSSAPSERTISLEATNQG